MTKKMSKEQEKAIKTIDRNVSVDASAGTGKTFVLSNRYVELLKNGDFGQRDPISSIVAITFTNKATEEMIFRIRELIKDEMEREKEPWQTFYTRLDFSRISTIDSFCKQLISQYIVEVGIDPNFEVLDEGESSTLIDEALDDIFAEEARQEDIDELLVLFGFRNIDFLKDDLRNFYSHVVRAKHLDVDACREQTYLSLKTEVNFTGEIERLLAHFDDVLTRNANLKKLLETDRGEKYFAHEMTVEEKMLFYREVLEYIPGGKNADDGAQLAYYLNHTLLEEECERWEGYEMLFSLLKALDEKYTFLKRQENVLDFNDLLRIAYELLEDDKILKEVQDSIAYVMVDEFQDTNQLQYNLFKKICSVDDTLDRQNLFIVGDPKQSIYGFRGADVNVFYEGTRDIVDSGGVKISMQESYRSSKIITGFVNHIFRETFTPHYEELIAKREDLPEYEVEFLKGDLEKSHIYAANYIEKLGADGVDWKDIGVLFRGSKHSVGLEEALREKNIPYVNYGSTLFFEKLENLDMLNLLKIIAQPNDDIALYGWLKSPMAGLKDDTVANFYMNRDVVPSDEEEQYLLARALEFIDRSRTIFASHSLSTAVEKVMDLWLMDYLWLFHANGLQEKNNLDQWYELAKEAEEKLLSLDQWIDQLESLRNIGHNEATVYQKGKGAVALMTIHKAKGLEFDYLLIPELHRRSNNRTEKVVYSQDKGIGVNWTDMNYHHRIVSNTWKKEENMEEWRVLYVALTRAEKKLVIGTLRDKKAYESSLLARIEEQADHVLSEIDHGEEVTYKGRQLSFEEEPVASFQPKTELSGEKRVYSISAYQLFRHNPVDYCYKYILRTEELKEGSAEEKYEEAIYDAVDGIQLGIWMHEWIENYDQEDDVHVSLNGFIENLPTSEQTNYSKVIESQGKNFAKAIEDYKIVAREWPFYVQIGGHRCVGFVDLIVQGKEGYEIWDIKTNRFPTELKKEELIDWYRTQLVFYHLGLKENLKDTPFKTKIIFLHDGSSHEFVVEKDDVQHLKRELTLWMDFVSTHRELADYQSLIEK